MKIWHIALNTFREAYHNKVPYIGIGFAGAIIIFSLFMGEVSLYQNEKVVKDVGLAAISLLGVFVAIYMGVTTLYQELERRTIYTIVSKPISRSQILIGRYLGMGMTVTVVVSIMTLFLIATVLFINPQADLYLAPAIFLSLVELWLVAAMATLFSSFSTPFLSGFFTFGMFIVGRITNELGQFGERSKDPVFKFVATSIQKVYDLEAFQITTRVVHKLPIYAEHVWLPTLNAVFLIAVLLTISVFLFSRRDFK